MQDECDERGVCLNAWHPTKRRKCVHEHVSEDHSQSPKSNTAPIVMVVW